MAYLYPLGCRRMKGRNHRLNSLPECAELVFLGNKFCVTTDGWDHRDQAGAHCFNSRYSKRLAGHRVKIHLYLPHQVKEPVEIDVDFELDKIFQAMLPYKIIQVAKVGRVCGRHVASNLDVPA